MSVLFLYLGSFHVVVHTQQGAASVLKWPNNQKFRDIQRGTHQKHWREECGRLTSTTALPFSPWKKSGPLERSFNWRPPPLSGERKGAADEAVTFCELSISFFLMLKMTWNRSFRSITRGSACRSTSQWLTDTGWWNLNRGRHSSMLGSGRLLSLSYK